MHIKVAVSGRHAHLTQETAERLCLKPKPERELGVRGNYASNIKLKVGNLTFRLLLPYRKYDQFEVLASDCPGLGIKPCYRQSGKLEGAPMILCEDLFGHRQNIPIPAIVAIPHIHTRETALWTQTSVKINGAKTIILHDVCVWPTPGCDQPVLHIDRDEALGFGIGAHTTIEAALMAWQELV